MPFLRFSRDKRGYEHTYLVHTASRRGKPSRPRILYWYRTPPGVRVGRKPFDEEVRRTIEAQHPGVVFDWDGFGKAQIPALEPEPWWERRRAERAAKQARRADDGVDEAAGSAIDTDELEPVLADEATEAAPAPSSSEWSSESGAEIPISGTAEGQAPAATQSAGQPPARKRRRRGGRRRRGNAGAPGEAPAGATAVAGEPIQAGEAPGDAEDFEPSSPEE